MLVETLVSAISPGTEMLFYHGQAPLDLPIDATISGLTGQVAYPLKYGYACVGRVTAVGANVDPAWQGRLVFAFHPHESHFVATPAALLVIPSQISPEQATFLPNMESAVNFVMDGQPMIGERVMVWGQGVVGLLTTALLACFPLAELITVEQHMLRSSLSQHYGAKQTLTPTEVMPQTTEQVDLAFELSGNPAALDQAIAHTGFDGRIVIGSWYGQRRATLDLGGAFHRSRIRLISSQVSTLAPAWLGRWSKARRHATAWTMLEQVDVAKLITHRFKFQEAAQAYRLIDQHPEEVVQVLLTYK